MVTHIQLQKAELEPVRRRRRFMPIMLTLAALLLLAWGGYWYTAYSLANGFISDASAAQPSDNIAFGCGDRRLGGFPLQLTVDCQSVISTNGQAMRASLGGVAATAPLYNPGRVQADIVGPFEVVGDGYAIRSNWRGGSVGFTAGLDGVRDATAAFSSLDFEIQDAAGETQWSANAAAWSTQVRPAVREQPALHVVVSAADLNIAFGGDAFPEMSGTANLTLLGAGNRIDGDPARILGRWLGAGGDFQIDFLTVTSGDVLAEITGPMSLGRNGSLTGRVMVRYVGQEDLPTLVAAIFPWYADDAETIAEAIRALSREIQMRGELAHEVQLIIEDGVVKIGLIPILTIPSVGDLNHLI
jgi:hypothetical protein